ncbi:reverse transcriptase family protein [Lonsdalea quercina]|uniref:reverse transcriptase family protein n=1 Tax=Lonsdalea quercina TaxID=71657 RepID=UPI0039758986
MNIRHTKKNTQKIISSIKNLCDALDIKEQELTQALSMAESEKYHPNETPKSDGSIRKIYNPHPLIRKIQRRIKNRIFNNYTENGRDKKNQPIIWGSYLFGSIPNQYLEDEFESKDYISCAKVHCLSKSLLKIDIKNFFDNVQDIYIENIFIKFFHFSEDVSKALTKICCMDNHLVQGGITSSYLACLCLYDVEPRIVERLGRKNLRYTRLVDDITISSTVSNYDFTYAKDIVISMLHDKDLPVNKEKTKEYYISTAPLTVHGLRVSFKDPRLPADEARRIRASVKNIECLSSERNYRTTHAYRKDFNRCMGKVNKLGRVNHSQYEKLLARLLKILPLPSRKDIDRIDKSIYRLEDDYKCGKADSYWYRKRFYKVHERINILQRTFIHKAKEYRIRLKTIKPKFEK